MSVEQLILDLPKDKGFKADAEAHASAVMCKSLHDVQLANLSAEIYLMLKNAYLAGAQAAVRLGYNKAEREWEDAVREMTRRIAELEVQLCTHDDEAQYGHQD